jgi:hypothetical protein
MKENNGKLNNFTCHHHVLFFLCARPELIQYLVWKTTFG